MKRGWIGVALLLILLAGGGASAWSLSRKLEPMGTAMEQAAEAALSGDWEKAGSVKQQVQKRWECQWHGTAAFSDHGPMEAIDGLFAQLDVYEKAGETLGFAAVCGELSRQLAALGEAHVPNWWNLL